MMSFFDQVGNLLSGTHKPQPQPQDILARLGAPSVSVAVLDHGNIEARCFSTLGYDHETVFQACSISKPVCAMTVARLIDDGTLTSLDDMILDRLPGHVLESLGPLDIISKITIKQLLSHTSGLGGWGFRGYVSADAMPSTEDVVLGRGANSMPITLEAFPGKQFRYSGGGYMVLQLALETIMGKPFPEIVRETVLTPLGMARSFYDVPKGEKNVAESYYTGFAKCEDAWYYLSEHAAGGLWTTPTDLLKLIHALQKSHEGEASSGFISKAVARELLTEVRDGMGAGFFLSKTDGISFSHSGDNWPGYACHAAGYANVSVQGDRSSSLEAVVPESGVVLMTNSAFGPEAYAAVLNAVTYLKGWPTLKPPALRGDFWVPLPDRSRLVDLRWAKWLGSWTDGWALEKNEAGEPMVRQGDLAPQKLVPVAMTASKFPQGESVDLLVDGMRVMLRLCWSADTGEEVVQVWSGLTNKQDQLTRLK